MIKIWRGGIAMFATIKESMVVFRRAVGDYRTLRKVLITNAQRRDEEVKGGEDLPPDEKKLLKEARMRLYSMGEVLGFNREEVVEHIENENAAGVK